MMTVRLVNDRSICIAPEYVAEELLRAEGFTDIRYDEAPGSQQVDALLRGDLDFANFFPGGNIPQIDAGVPIVVLAAHSCRLLRTIRQGGYRHIVDLKGKTIGLRVTPVGVLTLMAAEVGLDPTKDIYWVTGADRGTDPLELFVQGKIDAFPRVSPGASGTACCERFSRRQISAPVSRTASLGGSSPVALPKPTITHCRP